MTDDEAAGLLGIAYTALRELPVESMARVRPHVSFAAILFELARLRNQSPEDVQREFEK